MNRMLVALCAVAWLLTAQARAPDNRLTLNFQNMELRSALYALADYAKLDMIVHDSVKGQLTLRLQATDWQQALGLILQSQDLEQQRIGQVLYIAKREALLAQDKQRFDSTEQRRNLVASEMQSFLLQHRPAADMRQILEDGKLLSNTGRMLVDAHSNRLFVQDTPERRAQVANLLAQADQPLRQVMIEARIVEADDHFSRELGSKLNFARSPQGAGVDWRGRKAANAELDRYGLPSGVDLPTQLAFGSIAALFKASAGTLISLELQAMQAEGQGKVISSPRLLAADRSEASIEEGSEIPYPRAASRTTSTIDFKKAALGLRIKPRIAPDNRSVWVDIEISKDSPNFAQSVRGTPSVNTKRIKTAVQIENGGTVVLGGIYSEEQHQARKQVPWLGNLPLLGPLFRNTLQRNQRRELLVFITPHILPQR